MQITNEENKKVLNIIWSDLEKFDKLDKGINYTLIKTDDADYLYLPLKFYTYNLSEIDNFLNKKVFKNEYFRLELSSRDNKEENIKQFFNSLNNNIKSQYITELKVENDFLNSNDKNTNKLQDFIVDKLKNFDNLEVFECFDINVVQFLELSKNIKYIFSSNPSSEFVHLSKYINLLNDKTLETNSGKFSVSDCKYSNILRVKNIFDTQENNLDLYSLFDIATNIDKVQFEFENIDEKEEVFINEVIYLLNSHLNYSYKNIEFNVFSKKDNQIFDKNSLIRLNRIDKTLKNLENNLKFTSDISYKHKNIEEIIKASSRVNEYLEIVHNPNYAFSPYEKFLMLYHFTKSNFYGEDSRDIMKSRNIIDLLNTKTGVCVAFSDLYEYLLLNSGFKFIKDKVVLAQTDFFEHENHIRNVVKIEDKKYNINGIYISDATFGSLNNKSKDLSFCFAQMNLDERLENIYDFSFTPIIQLSKMKNLWSKEASKILTKPNFIEKFYKDLNSLGLYKGSAEIDLIKEKLFNLNSLSYNQNIMTSEQRVKSQVIVDTILLSEEIADSTNISLDQFANAMNRILPVLYKNNLISTNNLNEIININRAEAGKYFLNSSKNCFISSKNNETYILQEDSNF